MIFSVFHKQKGALLPRDESLASSFLALFRDGLYFRLAKHANDMASSCCTGAFRCRLRFFSESPSNQIFPILPNRLIQKLLQRLALYLEEIDSEHSAVRLSLDGLTERERCCVFVDEVKTL